jgi:hypothetical protein
MLKACQKTRDTLKDMGYSALFRFETCSLFDVTPIVLEQRLKAKVQREEFAALAFAFFSLLGLVLIQEYRNFYTYYDLLNFLSAARYDFSHYYYAYWGIPFFKVLSVLEFPDHFVLVGILNILSTWFAVRVFGNKVLPVLVSVHMIYILSQGQIVGIMAGGFALLFAGLVWQRWHLAGIGMVIVLTKFQLGLIPAAALLLCWNAPWKQKLKVLIVPTLVFLLSLLLYPGWPWQLVLAIKNNPPYDDGSIALWRVIGPFSLFVWIPPLFFSTRSKNKLFYLLITANILGLPYFQQTDLLLLLVLMQGYGALLTNLPFFLALFIGPLIGISPWFFIRTLMLIPLVIYFHVWLSKE